MISRLQRFAFGLLLCTALLLLSGRNTCATPGEQATPAVPPEAAPPPAAAPAVAAPKEGGPSAPQLAPTPTSSPKSAAPAGHKVRVVSIPVREAIDEPVLFVIRRALKRAITEKVDVVVLDMETPGGSLKTTFDILKDLEKFEGQTITYVNREAISAGALIAAGTNEIWLAPKGVIGAAAPVMSGGKDIEATMKQKIVSYLTARVRALSQGKGYRGEVVSAMINSEVELKIGDKVIKPKGELLTLTDTEAVALYGQPPQPLLGEGIAKDLDSLLASKYGKDGYELTAITTTWSEDLAGSLHSIAPLLMGLGVLALIIEFKTPGFGFFGIAGIVLLAIVFLSNYVAGLSGHEPIIVFGIGLLLLVAELLFFPGVVVVALLGIVMMLGSLVWSMADLWPGQPISITGDVFVTPLLNLGLGLGVALVLALLVLRFLPHGWMWDKMIVTATVDSTAQNSGSAPAQAQGLDGLLGATGVVVTDLRPFGQVEIGGRRYEARVEVGVLEVGSPVVVRGRSDFGLVVDKA